jgi:hypothetical protein
MLECIQKAGQNRPFLTGVRQAYEKVVDVGVRWRLFVFAVCR